MSIEYYSNTKTRKQRALKRRILGIIAVIAIILLGVGIIGVLTDNGAGYQERKSAIEENHTLREENEDLKAEVSRLTEQLEDKDQYINELTGIEGEVTDDGTPPRG